MMKSLFVVCVVLFVCAIGVVAAPVQENDSIPQHDQPPAQIKNFDWGKEFDASIETDPERQLLARQYTALAPLARKMEQFFIHEQIDAISLMKVKTKQLGIRCKLETKLQEKKKCLEALVFHLKQIQEAQHLLMEEPARPAKFGSAQISQKTIDDLVNYSLKTIEWESELERINEKLAAETKR